LNAKKKRVYSSLATGEYYTNLAIKNSGNITIIGTLIIGNLLTLNSDNVDRSVVENRIFKSEPYIPLG
jgi:hypothetical protein